MVRTRPGSKRGQTTELLFSVQRGQGLGLLPREAAERGYSLYREGRCALLVWRGADDRHLTPLKKPIGQGCHD